MYYQMKISQLIKSVMRIGGSAYIKYKKRNILYVESINSLSTIKPYIHSTKHRWSTDLYISSTKIIGVAYGLKYAFGESHLRSHGLIYVFGDVSFIFSLQKKYIVRSQSRTASASIKNVQLVSAPYSKS